MLLLLSWNEWETISSPHLNKNIRPLIVIWLILCLNYNCSEYHDAVKNNNLIWNDTVTCYFVIHICVRFCVTCNFFSLQVYLPPQSFQSKIMLPKLWLSFTSPRLTTFLLSTEIKGNNVALMLNKISLLVKNGCCFCVLCMSQCVTIFICTNNMISLTFDRT